MQRPGSFRFQHHHRRCGHPDNCRTAGGGTRIPWTYLRHVQKVCTGLGCCHFQRSDLRNLAPESSAVPGNAPHGSDHGVCLSPDGTAAVCHGVPQSQQSDPGARHRAKRCAAVHSIPPSASGNHCQSPAASGARGVPDTCCRWNRGDSLEADALGGGAFRRVICEQKCKSFIFVYNLAAWLCYNNKRHCIRA